MDKNSKKDTLFEEYMHARDAWWKSLSKGDSNHSEKLFDKSNRLEERIKEKYRKLLLT